MILESARELIFPFVVHAVQYIDQGAEEITKFCYRYMSAVFRMHAEVASGFDN